MKKISVDHLARVEGSGGISATIEGKMVTDVKFTLYEGPRLVERLTVGKTPQEVVNIVPRICAICSVSHKLASIRAVEDALSIKVPPKVALLREFMHLGETIESHSLHTYYLALPDYVGFPNAIAMASKFDLEVKIALEMKEFGNHIMKTATGRFIHGENPIVGGFGRYPSKEELTWIKNRAIQFMPFVLKTAALFCELEYPDIPEEETTFACCHPPKDTFGLMGEEIILSTGDIIRKKDYKKLTNEFIVPHSYAKHSLYSGMPYSVGALARIINLGQRLGGEAGALDKKYFNDRWKKNPLFNNAAQALETLYAFERIPEVISELLKYPEDPPLAKYSTKNGKGVGIVEAPRGLLIHSYEITDGLVSQVDVITPTAQNQEDIERYCHVSAQKLLDQGEEEKIKDRMEMVVRSYDPCISCSVHMVEVKKAPADGWKEKLAEIMEDTPAIFIGIGNKSRSDDGVGIEIAHSLQSRGMKDVILGMNFLPEEKEGKDDEGSAYIFIDALNFGVEPGKVILMPLQSVLWNSTLSHRLAPFLSAGIHREGLKKSFLLGIQPESIEPGNSLSTAVQRAAEEIIEEVKKYAH